MEFYKSVIQTWNLQNFSLRIHHSIFQYDLSYIHISNFYYQDLTEMALFTLFSVFRGLIDFLIIMVKIFTLIYWTGIIELQVHGHT